MNRRYIDAIEAAIEEPGIDFKRAMPWSKEEACFRFELVKDIGAMCCYGGGLLIIGRNDEDKKVGSLTNEQAATFETTKVNEFARRYLRPLPPIRVAIVTHRGDRLAILDIPGFTEIPPCVQMDSKCLNRGHSGLRAHFRCGDVFIRTAASQTARLSDPDDWRMIWSQMERNIRESVTFGEVGTAGDATSRDSYEAEYEEEEQNFRLPFPIPTTVAVIELQLRPEVYLSDRIPRGKLKDTLASARASAIIPHGGQVANTPFEKCEFRNTRKGVMLMRNAPEVHECESGVLRTSGYLIFRRILPDEYNAANTIEMIDRKLPFLGLALQLKLLLEFGAQLSQLMASNEETIELSIAVGGLANRVVEDDSERYGTAVPSLLALGGPGYPSTEQSAALSRRMSVEDLTACYDSLSVEIYQEALYGFGIEVSAMPAASLQEQFSARESATPHSTGREGERE
ncbi:MAG: hypothetical protein WA215_08380 [Candidatus Cybelea sp.]